MILLSGIFFIVIFEILQAVLHQQIREAYSQGYGYPGLIKSCGILVLTFPFATLIHELGHFAAGMACRQACLNFTVGPLEFEPRNGRWRLNWVVPRRAGFVRLVPSSFDNFRFQRGVCAAAGPGASALAAPIFLFLALHAQSALAYWIWSFAVQWTLVGVASIAPIRVAAARSDGYHLWEAIRGGTPLDFTMRDLLTPASHGTPLRVADWPHDLVARALTLPNDSIPRFSIYLNYIHFLDRGDSATAGKFLDQITAFWTLADPPEFALEAAYFLGFRRNDPDAALIWLEKEKRDAEPWVRLRARAAVERAGGNTEKCHCLIVSALEQLRAQPHCGAWQYEMDRLSEML